MHIRPLPTRSIEPEDFVRIVVDVYRHQSVFESEAEPGMNLSAS